MWPVQKFSDSLSVFKLFQLSIPNKGPVLFVVKRKITLKLKGPECC